MSTEQSSRAQQVSATRRGDAAIASAWLIVSSAVHRLHESWEAVAAMKEATEPSDAWIVAGELLEEASALLWQEFPVRLGAFDSQSDDIENDWHVGSPFRHRTITDEIQDAMRWLLDSGQSQLVQGLLGQFGAARFAEVLTERYGEFLAALRQHLPSDEPVAEVVPLRPAPPLAPGQEKAALEAAQHDVEALGGELLNAGHVKSVRAALEALGVSKVTEVPQDSIPAFMRMMYRIQNAAGQQ